MNYMIICKLEMVVSGSDKEQRTLSLRRNSYDRIVGEERGL